MYEPAWVQVKDIYEVLKEDGVDAEIYRESAEWENGLPFPGDQEVGLYVKLEGSKPQNLTDEGFNKSRKDVKEESKIDESTALSGGYLVRKIN
jgi:hypothetical protein